MKYAEIALALPVDKTFHYKVPDPLKDSAAIGKRAWVSFGNRRMAGMIVGFADKAGGVSPARIKEIESVIDRVPIVSGEMIALAQWISDYYCASLGSALHLAIPAPLKKGRTSINARAAHESVAQPALTGHLVLTAEQAKALGEIKRALGENRHRVFLLHGVTSSGKTEVYIQAIDEVLKNGKTAIVLVPEISLTPQAVERFSARFGGKVAVIHSRVTGGERYEAWRLIKEGERPVVIGARSALFSPLRNLGLIVVDEEHETSYKQEDAPRYHARDAAVKLAELAGCPVILGSATPSLESFHKALTGKYTLLELTKRIDDRPMPRVRVIDMRREIERQKRVPVLSRALVDSIEKTLAKKEQTMLFLNRRGFSTYIMCRNCGYTAKCKKCDSILVYHSAKKELLCHYCSYREEPPKTCPDCKSGYMRFAGKGTEKIESEVQRTFPAARIGRMDTDAMRRKGSHGAILARMRDGEIDILVGTQMIAKGHDFPQVTLVGVISADLSLNIPDFRSGERTFCLLTQVAGRAGRGANPGEVILQTYAPDNYAVTTSAVHDYAAFSGRELEFRKKLGFPPYKNLIKITVKGRREASAKDAAAALAGALREHFGGKGEEVAGPAPGVIPRIRGRYIWNVIIKTEDAMAVSKFLKGAGIQKGKAGKGTVVIDVDPVTL